MGKPKCMCYMIDGESYMVGKKIKR